MKNTDSNSLQNTEPTLALLSKKNILEEEQRALVSLFQQTEKEAFDTENEFQRNTLFKLMRMIKKQLKKKTNDIIHVEVTLINQSLLSEKEKGTASFEINWL